MPLRFGRCHGGVLLCALLLILWSAVLGVAGAYVPALLPAWLEEGAAAGATWWGLILAGLGLGVLSRPRHSVRSGTGLGLPHGSRLGARPWRLLPAAALLLYALGTLGQLLLGPALPWLGSGMDGGPGMAPTVAVALGLAALLLAGLAWGRGRVSQMALQGLFVLLMLVVLLGGVARLLEASIGFEVFIFHGLPYALDGATAIGLGLLCAGIGLALAASPGVRTYYRGRLDRQIFLMGASLLLIMGLLAWGVGASAFMGQTMSLFRNALQGALAANSSLLVNAVNHANEVAEQHLLHYRVVSRIQEDAPAGQVAAELEHLLDTGQPSGVAALWVEKQQGEVSARVGQPALAQENRVRIADQIWMFWDGGYWVEIHRTIVRPALPSVTLVAQFRLNGLDAALSEGRSLADTSELVICAALPLDIGCFPTRLAPQVFSLPRQDKARHPAMAGALGSLPGLGMLWDYRQHLVIAAYAPLSNYGLHMMQKVDLRDLQDSLIRELWQLGGVIFLLVQVGSGILYLRVRPTIRELAEINRHLEEAQRIGQVAVWECDLASGRVTWSKDALTMLDLGSEVDLSSLDKIWAAMPPEDHSRLRPWFDAAVQAGEPFTFEHQYCHPDGGRRAVSVQAQVFRGPDGRPRRVAGVSRNITRRMRDQQRIQRRDALLNESQRMAQMGSWEWRIDTDERLWSDGFLRLFGYEPGKIVPDLARFTSHLITEDFDAGLEKLFQVLSTGVPCTYQIRIRRVDGELRYLNSQAELVRDAEGNPLRLVGNHLDVTERVLAEKRLAYMTRLYALLTKANQAIIRCHDLPDLLQTLCRIAVETGGFVMAWACAVDKGQRGTSIHWGRDEGYLALVDRAPTDPTLGSGPVTQAIHSGCHVICNDIAGAPLFPRWQAPDLARGYQAMASFPVQLQGEVVAVLNLYAAEPGYFSPEVISLLDDLGRDLAFALEAQRQARLRQEAEATLQQLNAELEWRVMQRTQALEEANRELESFSYSVSHDLRAPLRSIDGFSQILLRRYQDQLDDAGRDYLQRVSRASQRMGHLIDDLLNLSRVGRGTLRRQSIDLSALAHSVVEELRQKTPQRQVTVHIQAGLSVFGDGGLLRILLVNLLGNAWKFTRDTPMAEITLGVVESEAEESPVYFVRDNGAGFDPAYVQKLFQPFQRLHAQSEFEGSGIGLATVHRIVRRHRGRIWAEGAIGQGATFFFTLPQRQRSRENEGAAMAETPHDALALAAGE